MLKKLSSLEKSDALFKLNLSYRLELLLQVDMGDLAEVVGRGSEKVKHHRNSTETITSFINVICRMTLTKSVKFYFNKSLDQGINKVQKGSKCKEKLSPN